MKFKVSGRKAMATRWDNPKTAKFYVQDRFSRPFWQTLHNKEVEVVNKLFREIHPDKILDLATGPARVARDLINFKSGVAVDYSEEMLKVAEKSLDRRWVVQKEDAFNLSFPDENFDAVTSFRFIRHFSPKDRRLIYKEIIRVLKPGGYFIFEALNKNMDKNLFKPQFTGAADGSIYDELYTAESITEELVKNGFKPYSLVPNSSFQWEVVSVSSNSFLPLPTSGNPKDSLKIGDKFFPL